MSFKPPTKAFGGFSQMPSPPQMSAGMPTIGSTGDEDEEIRLLTEQLQFELGNLSGTHSVLEQDMQRLASMLAPYMTPAGRLNLPENGQMDPKVLLFKQGLDFRIAEYNEDCKRLEQVQSRLQRKLEEAAGSYERTFMGVSGLADARVIRRLEELQRIIQVQQQELDQARFERDVTADEAKRLRQLFIRNGPNGQTIPSAMRQEPFNTGPGSLHVATAAKFAPMAGPSLVNTKITSTVPIPQTAYQSASVAQQSAAATLQANQDQTWASWIIGGGGQQAPVGPSVGAVPPVARRDFL